MAERSVHEQVGARIRVLRKAAGLTQAQVAEASGVASEYISRLESGQNMTIQLAASVATAIGVPLASLFESVDAPAPATSPAERRIVALVQGLDEAAKDDVYRALRAIVSVKKPTRKQSAKRARKA